jgi:hypothetical protein
MVIPDVLVRNRRVLGRASRVSGLAVPAGLTGLAALHAAWALGSSWPAGSRSELAEAVLSSGERDRLGGGLPAPALTSAVALALLGAAGVVRSVAAGATSPAVRRAAWGVAAAFAARSVAYLPAHLGSGRGERYLRLDRALYAPLCFALAAGTAIVLEEKAP